MVKRLTFNQFIFGSSPVFPKKKNGKYNLIG